MGDCVINTDCDVLVRNTIPMPAIVCIQRKAPKVVPTEDDIFHSNIISFGNAVGSITNRATAMYEVQSRFPKDSDEYGILDYRIKCGQLYQQNSIDKAKGIESNPMPSYWHSWIATKIKEDDTEETAKWKEFQRTIVVDKKPYFFQYIYPSLRTERIKYETNNNDKSYLRFRCSLQDLINKENKTDEEKKFVDCYYSYYPLGTAPCTINRICWKIEEKFDGLKFNKNDGFDYSILKCDGVEYSKQQYNKIKKIYESYKREVANYMQLSKKERVETEERTIQKYIMKDKFVRKCLTECTNEDVLCNIVIDLCYPKSNASKQFAWDICGDKFIENLLKRNDYNISYPTLDKDGDIEFAGMRFSIKTTNVKKKDEVEDIGCIE